MKKPLHQRIFQWLVYVLLGYSLAGAFLDATNNAISIITPKLGIILATSVILLWVLIEVILKTWSLSWVSKKGQGIRLKALGAKTRFALAGAALLLLVPWVISLTVGGGKQPLDGGVSGSVNNEKTQSSEEKGDEQKTSEVTILVADFSGPSSDEHGVEQIIFDKLEEAASKYSDLHVRRLGKVINSKEEALGVGKDQHADLVLWGSFIVNERKARITVKFDFTKDFFLLPVKEKKETINSDAISVREFTVQDLVSSQISYLALLTIGIARYVALDIDGAIDRLTDAVNERALPKQVIAPAAVYFYLGICHQFKRKSDIAVYYYTRAIRINPDAHLLALTYNNRGNAYLDKGDRRRALQDFNESINFNPTYAAAYYNRALLYEEEGDEERAMADLNKAISLPSEPGSLLYHSPDLAYGNRAGLYQNKGDLENALEDYNRAVELDANFAPHYYNRGRTYHQKGEVARAVEDYTQAIKLAPTYAPSYSERGLAYLALGDPRRAIEDFNQAICLDSEFAPAYSNRGNAHTTIGDFEHALEDFNQAIKLAPKVDLPYYNRANLYLILQKKEQARSDFQQVLKLSDDQYRRQGAQRALEVLNNNADYEIVEQ